MNDAKRARPIVNDIADFDTLSEGELDRIHGGYFEDSVRTAREIIATGPRPAPVAGQTRQTSLVQDL